MLTAHQLWLLLAVDAGVAIAGTLVVAHLLDFPGGDRGRSGVGARTGGHERSDAAGVGDTWHDEAVHLAGEVGRTVSTFDRSPDPDRVSRRLLPLSARIRGHVRTAPSTADAAVYRGLFDLGMACQRVAVEGRPVDGPGGYGGLHDRLDSLRSAADDIKRRAAAAG